jgi:hypothetical protein
MRELSLIPNLLPDEHIFSAFARLLLLNSALGSQSIEIAVIGKQSSLTCTAFHQHAFAPLLELYSTQKSREDLLNKHTCFGFYRHGMKHQYRCQLLDQIATKTEFYLPGANTLRFARKWRWCQCCVESDIQRNGTSYWHVSHQLPTAINCQIHNVNLTSKCGSCGYLVRDLRETPVPLGHNCPRCDSEFICEERTLSSDETWLQDSGLQLHENESSFLSPDYEYAMTNAIALITAREWQLDGDNFMFVCDERQQGFCRWLIEKGFDQLFDDGIELNKYKGLDIINVIDKPRSVPTITHLLWLRYLGVDSIRDAQRNGLVRHATAV